MPEAPTLSVLGFQFAEPLNMCCFEIYTNRMNLVGFFFSLQIENITYVCKWKEKVKTCVLLIASS